MDINPDTYHLKLEGDVLLIKGEYFNKKKYLFNFLFIIN